MEDMASYTVYENIASPLLSSAVDDLTSGRLFYEKPGEGLGEE